MGQETERLGTQKVEAHPVCDTLPIPHGQPLTLGHQTPQLLEKLNDPVRIAQASVALDPVDGVADPVLLRGCEARSADDETGDQEQRLRRVVGFYGVQDLQRLVDRQDDAGVLGREADRRRRVASQVCIGHYRRGAVGV